ncbi:hypothetical protein Hanom_Chr11g00981421 [Helianthus anomalus]
MEDVIMCISFNLSSLQTNLTTMLLVLQFSTKSSGSGTHFDQFGGGGGESVTFLI